MAVAPKLKHEHASYMSAGKVIWTEMDFVGLCTEVTEAIILYTSQLKSQTPEVVVCISIETSQAVSESSTANSTTSSWWAKCTIQANNLGSFFLDGGIFLQKLASIAKTFQQLLPCHRQRIQLWCCQVSPGNSPSMIKYTVEDWEEARQKVLVRRHLEHQQHLSSIAADPTNSISLNALVPILSCQTIPAEALRLQNHLHLLHIINPNTYFKLEVTGPGHENVLCVEKKPGPFKSLSKLPFRLATSLHHFLEQENVSGRGGKLRLLKGAAVLLPTCVPLKEGSPSEENLELSCLTALVPSSSAGDHLIYADRECSHVHVNIFGPGMVPVLMAGSQDSIPPSTLADWSQYKLTLRTSSRRPSSTGSVLVPSLCYEADSRHVCRRVLHLFMFLQWRPSLLREDNDRENDNVVSGHDKWEALMEFTESVRVHFFTFMSKHSDKVFKAVHSALNKLLYNYSSNAQLSSRIERLVPMLAEAVASIIQHSTTLSFKENSKRLLQIEDDAEIKAALVHKLFSLGSQKLGLELPPRLDVPQQDVREVYTTDMNQASDIIPSNGNTNDFEPLQQESHNSETQLSSASTDVDDFESLSQHECQSDLCGVNLDSQSSELRASDLNLISDDFESLESTLHHVRREPSTAAPENHLASQTDFESLCSSPQHNSQGFEDPSDIDMNRHTTSGFDGGDGDTGAGSEGGVITSAGGEDEDIMGGGAKDEYTMGGSGEDGDTIGGGSEDEVTMGGGGEDEDTMGGGGEDEYTMGGSGDDEDTMGGGGEDEDIMGGGGEDEDTMSGGGEDGDTIGGGSEDEVTMGGGGEDEDTMGGGGENEDIMGGGGVDEDTMGGGDVDEDTVGGGDMDEDTMGGGGVDENTMGGSGKNEDTMGGRGRDTMSDVGEDGDTSEYGEVKDFSDLEEVIDEETECCALLNETDFNDLQDIGITDEEL